MATVKEIRELIDFKTALDIEGVQESDWMKLHALDTGKTYYALLCTYSKKGAQGTFTLIVNPSGRVAGIAVIEGDTKTLRMAPLDDEAVPQILRLLCNATHFETHCLSNCPDDLRKLSVSTVNLLDLDKPIKLDAIISGDSHG